MASNFRYVTTTEADAYTGKTTTDAMINLAEEIIDDYVGFHNKYVHGDYFGMVTSATSTSLVDNSANSNITPADSGYFSKAHVFIVSGTGEGQKRYITTHNTNGTLTIDEAWTTTPDTTSVYRVVQLAKFPRVQDSYSDNNIIYKYVPEQVKRAVLAQVDYIANKGTAYFTSTPSVKSETLGDYSYTMATGNNMVDLSKQISPSAKNILRGLVNRTGTFK